MDLTNLGKGKKISTRLTVLIIAFSSAITLIISAIQLILDYRQQRQALNVTLEQIAIYEPNISASVWSFDQRQIELALEALSRLPNVEQASITTPAQDKYWSAGNTLSRYTVTKKFPLRHMTGNEEEIIGVLEVVGSLDAIFQSVAAHAASILLSNGLKTFLVALFMLVLFRRMVTNKLEALAQSVAGLAPLVLPSSALPPSALQQDASQRMVRNDDEFETLQRAFDDMGQKLKIAVGELRSSQQFLQSILDNSTAVIFVKDLQGRYLLINRRFEELFHYRRDAILGHTTDELFPEENAKALRAFDQIVIEAGRALEAEEVVPQEDGLHTYISIKAPLFDELGKPYAICAVATDITERKRGEEELKRHRDHLEELVMERNAQLVEAKEKADVANRAKSAFLASMSHELRTPLNAILGYAQILQRDKSLNERQAIGLATIRQSGEHLLTLINDVLDLTKIEAGKLGLYPNTFHLPTFLQVIGDIIRIKAEQKSLHFFLDAAADLPVAVHADEKRLRQVLLNLLGNAVKFTDRGEVTLRVREVSRGKDGSRLRFEVQDSGIGIESNFLEVIFQPFEQVGEVQRRYGGSGLGLTISRQLVELMDSDIEVESLPGKGCRFWFEITVPVEAELAVAAPAQTIAGYAGPRKRILVVDDVAENCNMLIDLLQALGFETAAAANGEQALRKAQITTPDLIIMDMVMPVMNGLQATRQLRASAGLEKIPVIAVSANAAQEDQAASLAAGADAFLTKPIEQANLLQLIGELLDLHWQLEPLPLPMAGDEHAEPLNLPQPHEISGLHQLALLGNMREIQDWATQLAARDPRYAAFSSKLLDLAQRYQSKAILKLVEKLMGTDEKV